MVNGRDEAVVVVAVDAGKEITDYALEWTIRNVMQPEDSLILLALIKSTTSLFKHSGTFQYTTPAASNRNKHSWIGLLRKWSQGSGRNARKEKIVDEGSIKRINDVCGEMMSELCRRHNLRRMRTHVVVTMIPGAHIGFVLPDKAIEYRANWLILDRRLKKESDSCLSQLTNCNIILIDHAIPKILRLIEQSHAEEESSNYNTDVFALPRQSFDYDDSIITSTTFSSQGPDSSFTISGPLGSSIETMLNRANSSPVTAAEVLLPRRWSAELSSNISATTPGSRSRVVNDIPLNPTGSREILPNRPPRHPSSSAGGYEKPAGTPVRSDFNNNSPHMSAKPLINPTEAGPNKNIDVAREAYFLHGRLSVDSRSRSTLNQRSPQIPPIHEAPPSLPINRMSSVRRAMSLSIKQPPPPPPLCSVCRHRTPAFGKPPRKFSYAEVERSTNGFAPGNFLAEGGYGMVYRGVLDDGQVVAVKKHKKVSAQGASEFCSEVEVLSCAQHRNLVTLVGYCMEEEWLLIYEFVCNGALSNHLHGNDMKRVMAWQHRKKVAMGSARALRYLHEDCRVGCIVHRDFRPNNILLTHDFEPMVGDFGLARWQVDGQLPEETRIVGTFGYLAPEYTQTGQITEKSDVYAFGVLLMELISGAKAIDLARCTGQQSLTEWARTLMDRNMVYAIIDPRLNESYVEQEVECMMYVASLCISAHPELRPRMSKVLRMLEGNMPSEGVAHRQIQMSINLAPHLRTTSGPTTAPLHTRVD